MTALARFRGARRDPALVVLEGLHALKHALRFGAEVLEALTDDRARLAALARELAPDVAARVEALATEVDGELLAAIAPSARTGVVALARRPRHLLADLLADRRPAPLVLLERPRALGNLGACVRVAAAAGAAGVLASGDADPWHPDAVRGAAGLQFALPVLRADGGAEAVAAARGDRPLLALDPGGAPLDPRHLPPRALLAFGSERRGLGPALLAAADARVGLPMTPGVSSLNLATAVAAVLFAWRLGGAGAAQAM